MLDINAYEARCSIKDFATSEKTKQRLPEKIPDSLLQLFDTVVVKERPRKTFKEALQKNYTLTPKQLKHIHTYCVPLVPKTRPSKDDMIWYLIPSSEKNDKQAEDTQQNTLLQEIKKLYEEILNNRNSTLTGEASYIKKRWNTTSINKITSEPEILKKIDITNSIEKIQELAKKYNILVLREPTENEKNTLLAYCGNKPVFSSAMRYPYEEQESLHHHHEKCLTIDYDLLMNPTIVADWPSPGVVEYLKDQNYRFLELSGENIPIFMSIFDSYEEFQNTLKILQDLLAVGGTAKMEYQLKIYLDEDVRTIESLPSSLFAYKYPESSTPVEGKAVHKFVDSFFNKNEKILEVLNNLKSESEKYNLQLDLELNENSLNSYNCIYNNLKIRITRK